jgi:formamidopyrimidine-DNA glycosylase
VPEGPEVEIVRLGLLSLKHQKIDNIKIANHPKYTTQKERFEYLLGSEINDVERRGKFLIFYFRKGRESINALNHLGMTGVWHIYTDKKWNEIEKPFEKFKHYKLYFHLETGLHVLFINVRTFGKFEIMSIEEIENQPSIKKLGPDILDTPFDTQSFLKRMKRRKLEVGRALLNYSVIAGCGNIYKSEALFNSQINPFRRVPNLKDEEIVKLGVELNKVAIEALNSGGSTLKDYTHVDGYSGLMQNKFNVYGLAGEPCSTCGTILEKADQGGRTSFWCPSCQPIRNRNS